MVFKELTNYQELKESLDISIEVSLGLPIFSADASMQFLRSGTFTRFSNYIFVDITVLNPPEILEKPRLTPRALRMAAEDPAAFVNLYGNAYISGRQTGGQLTALIRIESTDKEDYQRTHSHLSANVPLVASGKADLTHIMKEVTHAKTVEVHYLQRRRQSGPDDCRIDGIRPLFAGGGSAWRRQTGCRKNACQRL